MTVPVEGILLRLSWFSLSYFQYKFMLCYEKYHISLTCSLKYCTMMLIKTVNIPYTDEHYLYPQLRDLSPAYLQICSLSIVSQYNCRSWALLYTSTLEMVGVTISRICRFDILSRLVLPNQFSIFVSATSNFLSCDFFNGQVSLPCIMAALTTRLNIVPFALFLIRLSHNTPTFFNSATRSGLCGSSPFLVHHFHRPRIQDT